MSIRNNLNNKKGAVEMSLNLIIMLVIGLTVLGLIISFVTGFLSQATEGVGETLTEQDEQRLRDTESLSGNLKFLSSSTTIGRGESADLYLKFENPLSSGIDNIFTGGVVTENTGEDFYYEVTGQSASNADFTVETSPISLSSSETISRKVIVTAGADTPTGNYFLTFNWDVSDDESYSEPVTVVVE